MYHKKHSDIVFCDTYIDWIYISVSLQPVSFYLPKFNLFQQTEFYFII